MRVLIGCEFSGVVREAFRRRGHDAWSCDLLPADDGSPYHIQGDVLDVIGDGWDLGIFHPPCTYLCSSGLHWNKRVEGRDAETENAVEFVRNLLNASIPRIALENPIGCLSSRIRKPDQIVQPWQFGDDASKQTCLWLKGLPLLKSTNIVPPNGWSLIKYASDCIPCDCCGEPYCVEHAEHYSECSCIGPTQDEAEYVKVNGFEFARLSGTGRPVWANQTPGGQNKLGPSPDRWKLRSITYQGIAEAMAEQWSTAA